MARYHVNPATGTTGQCRAQQSCPFGSPAEHFGSAAEAEAHYAATMVNSMFVSHQKASTPKDDFEAAQGKLTQALQARAGVDEAKEAWEAAAVEFAATAEGNAHFSKLADGAPEGSAAQATWEHFKREGNRLRVERLTDEELQAIFEAKPAALATEAPLPVPVAQRVFASTLPPAPDWRELNPTATFRFNTRTGLASATKKDLVEYQEKIDEFLANPEKSTAATRKALIPAYQAFSSLKWASISGGVLVNDWSERAANAETYIAAVAQKALSHPEASRKEFSAAMEAFGGKGVVTHPQCPQSVKEDYIAMKAYDGYDSLDEEVLEDFRSWRMESNRAALYLSAMDEDAFHRQEAFNQVMVAGFDDYSKEDRRWLARNMSKLPTNDSSREILKDSLRNWAQTYADQEERDSLLAATAPPPEKETKNERRGIFGRRG